VDCFEWSAWRNVMPGNHDSDVHVAGRCQVESGSWQLRLAPGNEGIVDDPDVIVLELVVERPDAGTGDMAEREVSWRCPADERARRVRVQGEASAEIDIGEVH
jgi:hypothetical protein